MKMKDSREPEKKKYADILKMDIVQKDFNVHFSIVALSQKVFKYAKEVSSASFYNKTDAIFIMKVLECKTLESARNIMDKERSADSKMNVGIILRVHFYTNSRVFRW